MLKACIVNQLLFLILTSNQSLHKRRQTDTSLLEQVGHTDQNKVRPLYQTFDPK
jgi:hypothetical protein